MGEQTVIWIVGDAGGLGSALLSEFFDGDALFQNMGAREARRCFAVSAVPGDSPDDVAEAEAREKPDVAVLCEPVPPEVHEACARTGARLLRVALPLGDARRSVGAEALSRFCAEVAGMACGMQAFPEGVLMP